MIAEKTKEYKLTLLDRCDSCGAQAYVQVEGVTGELMFCSHHYSKIMDSEAGREAMEKFAFKTVDERERLGQKHSIYNF